MRLNRYACVIKVGAVRGGAALHFEELVEKLFGVLNWN